MRESRRNNTSNLPRAQWRIPAGIEFVETKMVIRTLFCDSSVGQNAMYRYNLWFI